MNIFIRFISSIIDKVIIVLLFVGVNLLISQFTGSSQIGIFAGCIGASSKAFEYMPNGDFYQTIVSKQLAILIAVSIIYYLVAEFAFRASLGKAVFGYALIKKEYGLLAGHGDAVLRATIRFFIFLFFIFLRQTFGMSVFFMFFWYVVITKTTILFTARSFIDLFSATEFERRSDIQKL